MFVTAVYIGLVSAALLVFVITGYKLGVNDGRKAQMEAQQEVLRRLSLAIDADGLHIGDKYTINDSTLVAAFLSIAEACGHKVPAYQQHDIGPDIAVWDDHDFDEVENRED